MQAQVAWFAALSENQKTKIENTRLELERAVQTVRVMLDSNISANSLREKILDTMGGISSQVLASALNAVNTSIGHSTSASEQRSENWGHSDSLRESHSFNDTVTS